MTTATQRNGNLRFAAVGLDHSHAFDQIEGLLGQGCELTGLSSDERDSAVAQTCRRRWPNAPWVDDSTQLLHDPSIDLVVTAAIPDRRAAIAIEALSNGKDVVADKPGCISLQQLDEVKKAVTEFGRFWSVTFSERFKVGCVTRAGQLVREGRIGQVVQTLGLGPHREGDRAHLAGGEGRPTGSMTESAREASSPTSPVTRSTSSYGSPALTPPKSCPARWLITAIPKRPGCRTSEKWCYVPITLMLTSELIGTPRKAYPPGATAAFSSWAPRATSNFASMSTSPAAPAVTISSWSTHPGRSTSTAPTSH